MKPKSNPSGNEATESETRDVSGNEFAELYAFLNYKEAQVILILEKTVEEFIRMKTDVEKIFEESDAEALRELKHKHKWVLELFGFHKIRDLLEEAQSLLGKTSSENAASKKAGILLLIDQAIEKIENHLKRIKN